jgi:uncharacterized protein YecT (DUF1311 family)
MLGWNPVDGGRQGAPLADHRSQPGNQRLQTAASEGTSRSRGRHVGFAVVAGIILLATLSLFMISKLRALHQTITIATESSNPSPPPRVELPPQPARDISELDRRETELFQGALACIRSSDSCDLEHCISLYQNIFGSGNRFPFLKSAAATVESGPRCVSPSLRQQPESRVATKSYPSFDCATNQGEDEIAICRSLKLAALDLELDITYRRLRSTLSQQEAVQLRDDQRAWLRQRQKCCRSESCLANSYEARIGQLQHWH